MVQIGWDMWQTVVASSVVAASSVVVHTHRIQIGVAAAAAAAAALEVVDTS